MGHGIAQITALAGYSVLAVEAQDVALKAGMGRIEGSLMKMLEKDAAKGKMSTAEVRPRYDQVMSRISTTTSLADAHDCDLIIEAIVEKMDVKVSFYTSLGPLIKPECIFASNTSSLPITNMAMASGRPDKFVGLHFFNPVQLMKLLEVIRTDHTSEDAFQSVTHFGQQIGKTTVSAKDTPGFIVNRLLVPYLMQAMAMVDRKGEAWLVV
jgi:3-hydroxyacyl-CoA dehydrogenase